MNVLITGGLGFIGSHIVKECVKRGYNTYILTSTTNKLNNISGLEKNITIITKDIRQIDKEVIGIDQIFHCASTTDNYNILSNPFLDAEVNVIGAIALLEACRKYSPNISILNVSTFFVNGNPPSLPVTESMKPDPLGLYGSTKLCAEHIFKTYARVFNIKSKTVRLSNVFGPYEQLDNNKKAAFNRMIWLAINDKTIELYNNNIKRDYIYIDDVIAGILKVMESGNPEKIYFIGRGEAIPMENLVQMILDEAKSGQLKIIQTPNFHNNIGITNFECDITDLKGLGWSPKVNIRTGIQKVIDFYRNKYGK